MHFTSLPGGYGIGDVGAGARRFIDRIAAMGLGVWQFLPTGPTGLGHSPYQPLSIMAGNPLLIDVAELISDGLVTAAEVEPLASLPAGRVAYARLAPRKSALLGAAAQRFDTQGDGMQARAYRDFCALHDADWLHDYALFSVLRRRFERRVWVDWDAPERLREPAALARVETSAADEIERIKIVQFLFDRQWQQLRRHAAERGVLLFGDVPIYMALDCAEAWARPDLLLLDASGRPVEVGGVPPDYFSADGQRWGNPLYRWDAHEREGYAWWIRRMRRAEALVDLIRIDHFRGFEAYWAIPAAAETARDGAWRAGPGHRLFDTLRAALGELPIVAEDLGIITDSVIALRRDLGLPGMQVLQFLVDQPDFSIDAIERDSVCYTGTHDNNTTVGWFCGDGASADGQPTARQRRILVNIGANGEPVHVAMIRTAFESAACIAIAPLQDFLGAGSEDRMNTPGTIAGNWQWRAREADLSDDLVARFEPLLRAAGRAQ